MLNDYKDKQPIMYNILKNEIENGQIGHAYLFDENNNTESLSVVLSFVKEILSVNLNDEEKTILFKRIDDGNYSELKIIVPDGMLIKKSQIIDLQQMYSMKAVEGTKRIYIIRDADKMRGETANSMLKFLEEPDNDIVAILMTNNINNMLSTIISRCQIIRLSNDNNLDSFGELKEIALEFLEKLSKKGISTLVDVKELVLDKINIKDRTKLSEFFDNLIDLYYDILKLKTGNNNIESVEKIDVLKDISSKFSLEIFLHNLEYLLDAKESIRYNVNCLALLDSVIFKIGGSYEGSRS